MYVYVLQSISDRQFYTGCTKDLKARVILHNSGKVTSTKQRCPFDLIYYEYCVDPQDAYRRERYLKSTYGKRYIRTRLKNYFKE
jgi:putative endonuclease